MNLIQEAAYLWLLEVVMSHQQPQTPYIGSMIVLYYMIWNNPVVMFLGKISLISRLDIRLVHFYLIMLCIIMNQPRFKLPKLK